jgi:hypothetical protein
MFGSGKNPGNRTLVDSVKKEIAKNRELGLLKNDETLVAPKPAPPAQEPTDQLPPVPSQLLDKDGKFLYKYDPAIYRPIAENERALKVIDPQPVQQLDETPIKNYLKIADVNRNFEFVDSIRDGIAISGQTTTYLVLDKNGNITKSTSSIAKLPGSSMFNINQGDAYVIQVKTNISKTPNDPDTPNYTLTPSRDFGEVPEKITNQLKILEDELNKLPAPVIKTAPDTPQVAEPNPNPITTFVKEKIVQPIQNTITNIRDISSG